MAKFSKIEEVENYLKNIELAMSRPGDGGRADTERAEWKLDEIADIYAEEFIRIFLERKKYRPYDVSRSLIWPLRNVRTKIVVEFLVNLVLTSKEFDDRISAAMALEYFDDFDLSDTFVKVLEDPDSSVQSVAVSYFEKHTHRNALPGLQKILENEHFQKRYPGLIDKAKRAVDKIKNDI